MVSDQDRRDWPMIENALEQLDGITPPDVFGAWHYTLWRGEDDLIGWADLALKGTPLTCRLYFQRGDDGEIEDVICGPIKSRPH